MMFRASDKLSAPPQPMRALESVPLIDNAACAILPKLNEIMAAINCCLFNGRFFILPPAIDKVLITNYFGKYYKDLRAVAVIVLLTHNLRIWILI